MPVPLIALSLVPNLINTGLKLYLEHLRLKMEAAGRTEITLADLEALMLEDPKDVVNDYRESQGLDPLP